MDTAVLFETFARPQYARQVFDQIKKAKPKKLYFYSNKARVWGIERSGFFNGRGKWAKGFENQRV